MNKKTIWGLVLLVVIVIVLIWTSKMKPIEEPAVNQTPETTTNTEPKAFVFVDQQTKEETTASFTDNSVTFTNAKLGTMTLPQTVSASGARYANADESIVFWNKGNDLFITQNGKIVFNGSTEPTQPQ